MKYNLMYGRSAIKENNMKWYTDGTTSLFIPEGTEPSGFRRGRVMKKKRR
jgi:hypothetical protein